MAIVRFILNGVSLDITAKYEQNAKYRNNVMLKKNITFTQLWWWYCWILWHSGNYIFMWKVLTHTQMCGNWGGSLFSHGIFSVCCHVMLCKSLSLCLYDTDSNHPPPTLLARACLVSPVSVGINKFWKLPSVVINQVLRTPAAQLCNIYSKQTN